MTETKKINGIILAYNTSTTKEGKKRYGIQIQDESQESYWINGFGDIPDFITEGVEIEAEITADKWKNIKSIEKAQKRTVTPFPHENVETYPQTTKIKLECARTIAIAMKEQLVISEDLDLFMTATKRLYEWVKKR